MPDSYAFLRLRLTIPNMTYPVEFEPFGVFKYTIDRRASEFPNTAYSDEYRGMGLCITSSQRDLERFGSM